MKENSILNAIAKKETKTEEVAEKVMENSELLPELLSGIESANTIRICQSLENHKW